MIMFRQPSRYFFLAIGFFAALYPASLDSAGHAAAAYHFGSVVENIQFSGIAPLPCDIYRYHGSERTIAVSEVLTIGNKLYEGSKIRSIYLRLSTSPSNERPDSAIVEVIEHDGEVRYAMPRVVHFDNIAFVSKGVTIDGQLVINSHDSAPYEWDVFYCPL